jgi:hypothetical protein
MIEPCDIFHNTFHMQNAKLFAVNGTNHDNEQKVVHKAYVLQVVSTHSKQSARGPCWDIRLGYV